MNSAWAKKSEARTWGSVEPPSPLFMLNMLVSKSAIEQSRVAEKRAYILFGSGPTEYSASASHLS